MNFHVKFKNSSVLFWLGILGLIFYVVGPIVLPGVAGLRAPELLPVYTLMMGLGQLSKASDEDPDKE